MRLRNTLSPTLTLLLAATLLAACTPPFTMGEPIDETLPGRGALIVLDVQSDFMRADGAFPVDVGQSSRVLNHVNELLLAQTEALDEGGDGTVVLYSKNAFDPLDPANPFRGNSAIRGTEGAKLDDRLLRIDAPVFTKLESDAFSNDAFDQHLRDLGITHVYLTGVYADGCVFATALAAQQRGYEVIIVEDAVASATDEQLEDALLTHREVGFEVLSTRETVNALLGR